LEAGATGLATKMVFMQFLGVNIQLWFNTKFLKLPFRKFLFHQLIVILVFTSIASGCSHIAQIVLSGFHFFITFLISGIIYMVLIIALVLVFPRIFALRKGEISTLFVKVRNKWPHKFHQDV